MRSARIIVVGSVLVMRLLGAAHADEPPVLPKTLKQHVDRRELAGAVMAVVDGKGTPFVGQVGWADIKAKQAMTPETLFWIASQSKTVAAVAVLMLVDEGKLSLDDPLEKHLPELRTLMVDADPSDEGVRLRKPKRPPTLRDALSHMSGMPFSSEAEQPTLDALTLAHAVKSYAKTPLKSDPGTAYEYSNAGVNTAARVVEKVSGRPYETFLQERLFDPLGMKNTTFWPSEAQVARLAKSYQPNEKGNGLEVFEIYQLKYPLSERKTRHPLPAGGLFSTAADVGAFCRMLLGRGELDGKCYLSAASFAELTKRQTPAAVGESYGLGLIVEDESFSHYGANATTMEIYPQRGVALIWMVQHAGYAGQGENALGEFRDWALERFGKKPAE